MRRREFLWLPGVAAVWPMQVRARSVGPTSERFSTRPSKSHDENGSSTTTGLTGTKFIFPDGRVMIEATELLTAKRTDGLNSSIVASCTRAQYGEFTVVEQRHYSYRGRSLPQVSLWQNAKGFPIELPGGYRALDHVTAVASQFGKNDQEDEGTGTPNMGLIQTNSEVFGASLKLSIMKATFGKDWGHNEKRLGALLDIFYPRNGRVARVPLVDIGPEEKMKASVDLTWATDQFLGTDGQASIQYRFLIPN